jgi:ABC-type multidrug transport system ATPase subunit
MNTENFVFNICNISKSYGKKIILDNISLSAARGQSVGILGTNGSGKSTLLSCIAKKYSKDASLGYIPQENPLFDELKPVDNIRLWTSLNKRQIKDALSAPPLSTLGITEFLHTPVKKMSGGMKKRLSIATALINHPDVLLLDEPLNALDMVAKQDILEFMRGYLKSGGIIIVASHDENIFNFCNRVYLLKNGHLTDTAELRTQGINYIDILRN